MTTPELVQLYSTPGQWYELRRRQGLEPYTRIHQWQIVAELLRRKEAAEVAHKLLTAEYIETERYAANLMLPYRTGEKLNTFDPADYSDDASLIGHIKELSEQQTYLSRERLIAIADHVHATITATGITEEHLELVSAILSTSMPAFSYPAMAKELEKVTISLDKAKAKSQMELAPAYKTLWSLTLKSAYLSKFEQTVRHCYLALTRSKIYPNLGIDFQNARSLSRAIRFLDDNRPTLWVLNESYSVDTLKTKYPSHYSI